MKFLQKSPFHALYEYQNVLLRIFSLLIQFQLNFDITYSLSRGKKRGVIKLFICAR